MAFNFGGAPTPGPAQAGGFNFGSPTSNAGQPAPSAFSFGTAFTPGPPQTPAGPSTSFSLGAGAPAPAAPTFGSPTNAFGSSSGPSPSFTFGSTAANTPAPGTFGIPAPAPAGVFSTGGTARFSFAGAAPATGATPGFSPSGTQSFAPTALATTSTALTVAPPAPRGPEVPAFHTRFPHLAIYSDIRLLLDKSVDVSDEGRQAALELSDRLLRDAGSPLAVGKLLSAPKPLQYVQADQNVRNQLQQHPTVVLPGDHDATLLPNMLEELYCIADDLRISEQDALVLYHEASKKKIREMLEEKLVGSFIDKSLQDENGPMPPLVLGTNVVKAAKELYFFEHQRNLHTTLVLAQSRIAAPQKPWGDLIIQSTDSLLQNKLIDNLIDLIRQWTLIIGGIEQSLERDHSQSFGGYTTEKKKKGFDMVHLKFAKQERQTAAEVLFYLSYQTQLEVSEVASLIDLIRDLTNGMSGDRGLPILDPFKDVPSSYEESIQVEQPWAPYHHTLPPQKELNHLEWERLFVKKTFETSLPELLRCVSTLIMTVVSAMDTKQVLIDRNTHCGNDFGTGNKLCPPEESTTVGLEPIKNRLTPEAEEDWMRTDIFGLFCGSYAMLISNASRLLSSPRVGSSPSKVLLRAVEDYLAAPMLMKSISFSRLCLLPSLQRPSLHPESWGDSSEFLLSVLSDFVASFLDILTAAQALPGSRAEWKKEQEEDLAIQRDEYRQQREFQIWSGDYRQRLEDNPGPTSVNLASMPDCMDDIIALAVAVASLGPDFARKFWSPTRELDENGNAALVPSKALKKLKSIIAEDESLTAFYYAFLAALSTARRPDISCNGAETVNKILSSPTESRWHWDHILVTLRWYFHQLDGSRTMPAPTNVASGGQSDSYYYRNVSVASSSNESAKSKSEPLPLGQANTFWLLSLLGLIENTANNWPSARFEILSKKLPVRAESSATVVGDDTTLNILFSLLTAPMTPEIRGAITNALASLLSMEGLEAASEEDTAKMRGFCSTAWELVEACQIVPIILLDQYPAGELHRSGLQFPASSTSLAGSGTTADSMIPCDQSYAILFEMEHVESHTGVYPSTEGFLSLLHTLFSCSCPSTLGQAWRPRTGCAPYVEYIIKYVLPRATGTSSTMGKLPFRSKADEARFVALTLQVIESVLIRYSFPVGPVESTLPILDNEKAIYPTNADAINYLGHKMLAEKVVDSNVASCTGLGRDDFENLTISYGQVGQMQTQGLLQPFQAPAASSSIPAPKSPGFFVLASILSASDGECLKALKRVIGGSVSVAFAVGNDSSNLADAYALYKAFPPTTSSAKHAGRQDTIIASVRENQLEGLRPCLKALSTYTAAVSWHERRVMHALNILCAAAVREDRFYAAVHAPLRPLRIVPTLRFDKKPGLASHIIVQSVHLARMFDLVEGSDMVMSIVDCLGQVCSTAYHDASVASAASGLMHFIGRMAPPNKSIEAVFGLSSRGNRRFSSAVARRLITSFGRFDSPADSNILSLILSWILSDLRKGTKDGFAHALFRVPEAVERKNWNKAKDSFGAILDILNDRSFIMKGKTGGFAASCFEILTRLCDLKEINDGEGLQRVFYGVERLRSTFFWRTKLELFFGWNEPALLQSAVSSKNSALMHCMAWLLKGVAGEVHMLSGFPRQATDSNSFVPYMGPLLGNRDALLGFLFGSKGIVNIFDHLPIERITVDNFEGMPSQKVIRVAMKELEGSAEVTGGYQVVDETLLLKAMSEQNNKEQAEELFKWGQSWNTAAMLDCAATHLSHALRSLVAISLAAYDSERAIPSDSLANILTSILGRLVNASRTSQWSPAITNNLSLIALLLSQNVVYPGSASGIQVTDLRIIRDLFARALVESGNHPGGPVARLHQQTTAILSASLVEVMQAIQIDETIIDASLYRRVAHTLAKLSVVVLPGGHTGTLMVPTESAIIARSSLGSIVRMWDQEVTSRNDSLAFTMLNEPPEGERRKIAEIILSQLSSLDDGMVTLVEELLHLKFVGDALLEQGLIDSLSNAAEKYMLEEQQLKQSCSQESKGRNVTIGFPSCLLKHLQLFRVLMATTEYLSDAHVNDLPKDFSVVLGRYRDVIERTFSHFSSHGEELVVLVQCMAEICMLFSDKNRLLAPPVGGRKSVRGSPIENCIQELTLHLAENPVPADWLANLPYSLRRTEKTVESLVVRVTVARGCTWWEQYQSIKRKDKRSCTFEDWTEDMFLRALLAADILKAGFRVLMDSTPKSFDIELSFVRGLFLLSKAAQAVQTQVELHTGWGFTPNNFMETDTDRLPANTSQKYLRKYGRVLHSCIERLLGLLVDHVKMFVQERENWWTESAGSFCKAVQETLDLTELEVHGIPFSVGIDEQERGKLLAAALRNHLQS